MYMCICIQHNSISKYTYLKTKGCGDSKYEFSLCIFGVLRDGGYSVLFIANSWGGGGELCAIIVELFTWESLQVPTSSYINLLSCIETFYILLLAFNIIGVAWEFLQVPTSTCSIMDFIFGFWRWCCLKALHWFPLIVARELLQTLV